MDPTTESATTPPDPNTPTKVELVVAKHKDREDGTREDPEGATRTTRQ